MPLRYILLFLAGATASAAAWSFIAPARAADPVTYTCTAVQIPITRAKKTDDPDALIEQALPPGYVPYGGGAGGLLVSGGGYISPYIIACRPN